MIFQFGSPGSSKSIISPDDEDICSYVEDATRRADHFILSRFTLPFHGKDPLGFKEVSLGVDEPISPLP